MEKNTILNVKAGQALAGLILAKSQETKEHYQNQYLKNVMDLSDYLNKTKEGKQ